MKKLISIICAGLMLISVSGCETMEGLGKDIENLGESIQKKADE